MQPRLRARSRIDRLSFLDEDKKSSSPSFFEWREQTIRTKVYEPVAKPQPKAGSFVRLFRRFS